MKTQVVMVSGGLGSSEALKRTIEAVKKKRPRAWRKYVVGLFSDVKGDARKSHFFSPFPIIDGLLHERFGGESPDTYRLLWRLSYHFDMPIERLEDGRTVFAVFAQFRFFQLWMGSGFIHKCSEVLKREVAADWLEANLEPGTFEIVLGFGWDEAHRLKGATIWWQKRLGYPVKVTAPCMEKPYADNCKTEEWLSAAEIEIPKSYSEGFDHNNCRKGCPAGGLTHWAQVYITSPMVYYYWMYMVNMINRYWGKEEEVTILKSERNGVVKPLSFEDFIERIKVGDYPKLDWGGCGCFAPIYQTAFIEMPPKRKRKKAAA